VSEVDRVISVRDDPDASAFVVEVDGARAGKAVYHVRGGRHLFVHTEVSDEFSGMGLGTRLVRETLEEMRARGELIVPICPFFVSYLARHPEFEDVVDREMTDRLNAARAAKDD
jgi:predicted GNAT family acetyltransferase